MEHFEKGSSGIADWASGSFLLDENNKPLIACTDKARKTFVYRDADGNKIRDERAEKLKDKIRPILEPRILECKRVNYEYLETHDDDNNEFTDRMFKIHKDNKEIGPDFEKRLVEIITSND